MSIGRTVITTALAVSTILLAATAGAQSFVERNRNAQGVTPPGEYQGIRNMQDNETTCAINPLLPRNILCAWNSSAGSDDLIGDTWIRWSESTDGGYSFVNQFVNGSRIDPVTSIGQDFAADPIMMCWPGGCGAIIIASTRSELGGAGGAQQEVAVVREVGEGADADSVTARGASENAVDAALELARGAQEHPALDRAAGDLHEGAVGGQVAQRTGHARDRRIPRSGSYW